MQVYVWWTTSWKPALQLSEISFLMGHLRPLLTLLYCHSLIMHWHELKHFSTPSTHPQAAPEALKNPDQSQEPRTPAAWVDFRECLESCPQETRLCRRPERRTQRRRLCSRQRRRRKSRNWSRSFPRPRRNLARQQRAYARRPTRRRSLNESRTIKQNQKLRWIAIFEFFIGQKWTRRSNVPFVQDYLVIN